MANKYDELVELFHAAIPASDEAQLTIYVKGEKVVDTATGINPDALTLVFSVSKALCALAIAKLVDEKRLYLSLPVAHYWPEFAAAGKDKITVRQLLSHQAGLPDIRRRLTLKELMSDHQAAELLAQEKPFWNPGSGFGYHGITIGTFMSELVYRITNKNIQTYYEEHIRNGADAYLGLPKELHHRFLPHLPSQLPPEVRDPLSLGSHVFGTFPEALDVTAPGNFASSEGLIFGNPAAGAAASARGLAQVFNWATGYGKAAGGISQQTLEDFSQVQVFGYDMVLDFPLASFGTVFMKPSAAKPFGTVRAFGHDGAAGAIVYADPTKDIVFAYSLRRFQVPGGFDHRLTPLIQRLFQLA